MIFKPKPIASHYISHRMTQILTRQNLSIAIDLLKADKPVAIPTETVYGLAANALSEGACRAIFHAKGRPLDNPLIVHISSKEMLRTIVDVDRMTPIGCVTSFGRDL